MKIDKQFLENQKGGGRDQGSDEKGIEQDNKTTNIVDFAIDKSTVCDGL